LPELRAVELPDDPSRWEALGFEIVAGSALLPGVRVALGASTFAAAIDGVAAIEGLALADRPDAPPVYSAHPNGALGLDHVVAVTPDFERTAQALAAAGLALRRIRDAGGFRQGFRRFHNGPILELVEAREAPAPAWWGLTVTVPELDALPSELVTTPKPAVQPGRMIARARTPGAPLAFITPES